ncbi:MAG: metallophosphoesterase family protein [Clostridia bacterium]|nr:metallophosphoesterase family protein [Clostridia bacterium]
MKKIISAVMCLVMLLSAVMPINGAAVSEKNSWTEYLEEGKGVYLGPGADDTEMYVTWYGGKDGVTPEVKVSTSKDMSAPLTFTGTVHSSDKVERSNHVIVTGLEKGKTYYYVCSDGTTDTEVKSFKTVAEGADFSAMYVSDIHLTGNSFEDESLYESAKSWDKVLVEATEREELSLILSGGDMATEGQPCEYYAMFIPEQVKTIPYAMAIGNHDVKRYTYDTIANYPNAKLSGRLSKSLIHGDYYFVKGNALFVVLDSTNSSAADHYFFVKKAVRENPDVKWRVMMFHHDLYGGHIESRESENMLLRLLFTPIIDAFQFDLVLTGHSHCFSRSHVIYRNKITESLTGKTSVTDPEGTIYLNNGSLRVNPDSEIKEPIIDSDRKSEYIATDYLTGTQEVYNILNFTDDSLTIKSYTYNSENPFTELTINKTTNEGGHPDKGVQFWFVIGKYIGTIYNVINNISRRGEIADRG